MDLNELLGGLSEQDMAGLKAAARQLLGGGPAPAAPEKTAPAAPAPDARLLKLLSGFSAGGNDGDPGSRLIAALRPLLSEPRRRRADEALEMLRLMRLLEGAKAAGLLPGAERRKDDG